MTFPRISWLQESHSPESRAAQNQEERTKTPPLNCRNVKEFEL